MGVTAAVKMARAGIVATIATFSALALHILAGGHPPEAVAVIAPWVLSIAVSMELIGPSLARWRVALAAAISQVFFHVLFTLGGAGSIKITEPTDPHGLHHAGTTMETSVVVDLDHGGMSMMWAHVAAAVIAYAAMRGGHRLCDAARVACRALWAPLTAVSSTQSALVAVPRILTFVPKRAFLRPAVPCTPVGLRAPPVFA